MMSLKFLASLLICLCHTVSAFSDSIDTKNLPFILDYPSSWHFHKWSGGNENRWFFSREPVEKPGDLYLVGLSVYWRKGFLQTQDWDTFIGYQKSKADNLEFKDMGIPFIDGCPSAVFVSSNQTVKMEFAFIKKGDDLVMIMGEAPPQEWDEYENVFNKGIKTFIFNKLPT